MKYFIYKLTNNVNNKHYIGFTSKENPKDRLYGHWYSARNNSNCLIHKAMRKYGRDNFSFNIIFESYDLTLTKNIMEPICIEVYNSLVPNGYNMTLGGEGIVGYKWTETQKQNQSGINNPMYGKFGQLNPFFGKKHTDETKKKLSVPKNALSGDNNPACRTRKRYKITFIDKSSIIVLGLNKFCKENNYNRGGVNQVKAGTIQKYKNIIGVEII